MPTSRNILTAFGVMVGVAVALLAARPARAADRPVEFNRDIRPILSDNCFACHGFDPKTRKAGLRLDTLEGATADHDGTRAIVAGDLAKSEAWARIISNDPDEIMPPPDSHKRLTPQQKQLVRRWIEQGAPYQRHWSFEPVRKPAVPLSVDTAHPIDAFLQARLKQEKLQPAGEADRRTLIRRVAFALTGLPPTPEEVERYLADAEPNAYERMVDRYLASPRFGEEMARHWLDLARYADTHGLHLDNERQMWAYRDWVVKAFNDNKPFDRFTIEQIAGDLLPNATKDQLTATGFNRCNVTTSEGGSIEAEFIYRYAVDRTETMASVWMGLTAGCAVCHDHKFDPISAKEFYSLYAFYNSAADPGMDGNALLTRPTIKLTTPEADRKIAELDRQIAEKQKVLDARTESIAYTDPAAVDPKPKIQEIDTVWVDDEFPAGAKVAGSPGHPTKWITAADGPVHSGARALQRKDAGLAQDYYEGNAEPLTIPAAGVIYAHVYLDPADLPKSVMVQLHSKGQWQHRAVWGDYDAIQWGRPKTTERVHMGALPAAGKWVRLEIPVEKIGLQPGDRPTGLAVTQFGGTVYWDKIGVVGRTDPAADPARSLLAWWKPKVGKTTPDVPPDIAKLLKDGPEKVKKPEDLRRLQTYYLQTANADAKATLSPLVNELNVLRRQKNDVEAGVPSTLIFTDLPKPRDSFVMKRGQYNQPGEKVEPGTPAFLPPLRTADAKARANRLDLANWLVSSEHPLTARVAVNRFWQQFFGVGLVKTSGDFGSQGEPPVHPELLDYLAAEFGARPSAAASAEAKAGEDARAPWDVKGLVRLMLTSAAFRRESAASPELIARDPENRLLARGPRFRLDAEQVRDNALFVSGLMNHQMGGPGVRPYQPPNIWEPVGFVGSNTRFYKQDTGDKLYRRSLYTFLKRTAHAPFLANFDAPNREQSCTRRERSNTPLQALQLMNDVQFFEASRALAERMVGEGGVSPEQRIDFAYRVVLSRSPDADELKIVAEQFRTHHKRYQADEAAAKKAITHGESKPKAAVAPAELAAYTLVANMILNLDETLNRN
jgi:hypothetical protein